MTRVLARAAEVVVSPGVSVGNASPIATLEAFERISYADAIAL